MIKKHTLLLFCLLTIFVSTQAQPWLNLLPKEKNKQQLTLKDHKQAFDAYWSHYNVKKGYYYKNGVKKKAYGWKQFMRWYYQMEGQVDANGVFPQKTAQQVYDEFVKTHPNSRSGKDRAGWTSLGTNSSTGGYAGIGRINCVAFHPSDNNTYWVGAPAGGLWVTRDNGASWTCLTDENQILGVSDIIIPNDYATSKTIYIGTGDRDAWDNRGIGVLKSTDDGATWNTTGLSFTLEARNRINRLLLDPTNEQTIIAATNEGVYKTTDGGTNWNNLSDKVFIDIEYKPGNFSTLYGSTENGEIYLSTDAGTNWNSVFSNGSRIELAVSAANADLVVAVVSDDLGGLTGIYKSTDSGASFTQILDGTTKNLLGYETNGSDAGGQGWYDLAIAVSPTDANTIFIGGVNTWKSTDGGTTWSISSHWAGADGIKEVHADKHTLNYRSNGDLFEGNDGGIYISTDNGTNWTDKSNGLVISQIYKLSVSAQESTKTLTGLQDNGSKLLENGTWTDVTGGDGMECLIDYTNSNIQYATYAQGEIYRTTNNWTDYETITPKENGIAVQGAWVTPYVISPTDHNTIYAGYENVWKTTDKGNTWTKNTSFTSYFQIRNMAIAPSNSSILYVTDKYSMWKTNDGSTSWNSVVLPTFLGEITSITIKNDNPEHLWITTGGYNNQGVFESTDGGTNWTNISAGLPEIPVYTIVQNKEATNEVHLYVGTELGVYIKKGTANWVEYNDGLPKVKCGELEIYYDNTTPANSRLRLASYGRGLWETPLASTNPNDEITLTTTAVTGITANSAISGGNITTDGGSAITARGIVWGTNTQPTLSDNVITDTETGIGEFTSNITGLSASTTYYVRAYATNANGTTYGNELNFSTTSSCEAITNFPFEEYFEGNTFPPQCWTSYVGANGLNDNPEDNWMQKIEAFNHAAYVFYNLNGSREAEDWLVTPPITLPSQTASLSFSQKQANETDYSGEYAIKLSTSSQTDIASFTTLELYGETDFTTEYTKKEIDLSAYKGQTVYIAFVRISDLGDEWYVDSVKVDGTSGTATAPVADFSANQTEICAGASVNFTDASTGTPTSWLWDFGDGTTEVTEQNPSHLYMIPGTYSVTLTATNANGTNTQTKTDYITVKTAPNAGTDGMLLICEGTTPSNEDLFDALVGTPDEGGTWTNDGTIYTYTVTGTAPCVDATATVTVTETSAPNAGTNGTLNICEGTTPSTEDLFNALNGNPDEGGTWSNDGLIYTYTISSPCGNVAATVTITETTAPNAGTDGTLSILEGTTPSDEGLFNALGGNPDTGGTWTNEGLIYTYTVTGNAPCGAATATVTVTEITAPNPGTNGTLEVCEGTTPSEEDLFNALGGNPDEGGTWTQNDLVYTYTVTNSLGFATATVTITEKALPQANFTTDNTNSPTIIFTNTSTNADSYNWDLGDGTTSTTANVEHTYTANGNYTISLEVVNTCGNSTHEETLTIATIDTKTIDKDNIKLYPNPANNYFKIELGKAYKQIKSISIIDNSGKVVYFSNKINQSTLSLSTKNLKSGIYLINLEKSKEVIVLELIISK